MASATKRRHAYANTSDSEQQQQERRLERVEDLFGQDFGHHAKAKAPAGHCIRFREAIQQNSLPEAFGWMLQQGRNLDEVLRLNSGQ